MTSAVSNDQVIALYESSNGSLTPEEISEACDGELKPAAIKIALIQGSKLYRQKLKLAEADFNQDDKDLAMATFRQLCLSADSDAVKFRSAQKMYDVTTGRDIPQTLRGGNFNLTLISQTMIEAEEAIKMGRAKVVKIEEKYKHLAALEV